MKGATSAGSFTRRHILSITLAAFLFNTEERPRKALPSNGAIRARVGESTVLRRVRVRVRVGVRERVRVRVRVRVRERVMGNVKYRIFSVLGWASLDLKERNEGKEMVTQKKKSNFDGFRHEKRFEGLGLGHLSLRRWSPAKHLEWMLTHQVLR